MCPFFCGLVFGSQQVFCFFIDLLSSPCNHTSIYLQPHFRLPAHTPQQPANMLAVCWKRVKRDAYLLADDFLSFCFYIVVLFTCTGKQFSVDDAVVLSLAVAVAAFVLGGVRRPYFTDRVTANLKDDNFGADEGTTTEDMNTVAAPRGWCDVFISAWGDWRAKGLIFGFFVLQCAGFENLAVHRASENPWTFAIVSVTLSSLAFWYVYGRCVEEFVAADNRKRVKNRNKELKEELEKPKRAVVAVSTFFVGFVVVCLTFYAETVKSNLASFFCPPDGEVPQQTTQDIIVILLSWLLLRLILTEAFIQVKRSRLNSDPSISHSLVKEPLNDCFLCVVVVVFVLCVACGALTLPYWWTHLGLPVALLVTSLMVVFCDVDAKKRSRRIAHYVGAAGIVVLAILSLFVRMGCGDTRVPLIVAVKLVFLCPYILGFVLELRSGSHHLARAVDNECRLMKHSIELVFLSYIGLPPDILLTR